MGPKRVAQILGHLAGDPDAPLQKNGKKSVRPTF
jgi:hypothetical protein